MTAERGPSLRVTLAAAAAMVTIFVVTLGIAIALRVSPAAERIEERSIETRRNFEARTAARHQLDSTRIRLTELVERAAAERIPDPVLTERRLALEAILTEADTYDLTQPSTTVAPAASVFLDAVDEAALRLAAPMFGTIGALEIGDVEGARALLARADEAAAEVDRQLDQVTRRALEDLVVQEGRLAEEARGAQVLIAIWLVAGVVLLPALAMVFQRRLFAPLTRLDEALLRIEGGDLDTEMTVGRRDELGRVAEHLNRTTRVLRLQRTLATRAAADAAREASEASYRAAFEGAAVGLAEIGLDGRFQRVNRAITEILGRSEAELVGRSLAEFAHPDDGAFQRTWPAFLAPAAPVTRLDGRCLRPDGVVASVQLTGTLQRDQDGQPRHLLAVINDVTEQRRLERELLQSSKMKAVAELAGGVAHDFNNLLTAIIGSADLIARDAVSDQIREDAGAIRTAALRGADLARTLLALGRRYPQRRESFDLTAALREIVILFQRTVDRRIELTVDLAEGLILVGDRTLVSNAVLNLALNARDAMPDGGRLEIATRALVPDPAWRTRHGFAAAQRFAVITVRDTGVGIEPDILDRIYEPFFTTKALGKGSGLGLSMVYATVRDHGGAIEVESVPGVGTCFTMSLPCGDGSAEVVVTPPAPPAAGGARILVVDDEPEVRAVAARMLVRLGYQVTTAVDGVDALERLDAAERRFDLVLLDGNMPRMNGLETARRIRERFPGLPVVLATGFFDEALAPEVLDSPFSARLFKPYTIETLSAVVADGVAARSAAG